MLLTFVEVCISDRLFKIRLQVERRGEVQVQAHMFKHCPKSEDVVFLEILLMLYRLTEPPFLGSIY